MRRTHTPTLLQRKMEIFDSDKCTVQGCLLVLFFNSCHIAPILQTTLEKIFSPSDCCYIFVASLVLSLKINFPLGRTCCLCILMETVVCLERFMNVMFLMVMLLFLAFL